MTRAFQAVLFDLDGTLLDSVDGLAAAGNRMLASKGYPVHPVKSYRYFVGQGAAVLVHRALPANARTDKVEKECLAIFLDDYGRNWREGARPYTGITEMLDELTRQGIRLAILSNKPHDITVQCVSHFFGRWSFEIVLGQRPQVPKKPDPAGALEVARHMNLPVSAFVYLGDTAIDMHTARAAGMFPLGVRWGFRTAEEIKRSGAQLLIGEPHEILTTVNPPPGID